MNTCFSAYAGFVTHSLEVAAEIKEVSICRGEKKQNIKVAIYKEGNKNTYIGL